MRKHHRLSQMVAHCSKATYHGKSSTISTIPPGSWRISAALALPRAAISLNSGVDMSSWDAPAAWYSAQILSSMR